MNRLEDRVAIITGAGRGIGLAAADAFVREGAKVVVAEIDPELGAQAESRLRKAGGDARFVQADCGDAASVEALMARTESLFGSLHVLYNNASIFLAQDQPVTSLDEAVWERVIRVNLKSVFLCCKYAVPRIIRSGGGSIINTASSAAVIGIPGCDAYTATKGATVSLTRSLAVEFGRQKVRVNCICPAGVETEMMRVSNLDNSDFDADFFFSRAPLGRFGRPEEIAPVGRVSGLRRVVLRERGHPSSRRRNYHRSDFLTPQRAIGLHPESLSRMMGRKNRSCSRRRLLPVHCSSEGNAYANARDRLDYRGCLAGRLFHSGPVLRPPVGEGNRGVLRLGRSVPWWLAGLSMVATTFSSDTPNLVTDIVRQQGVAGNWCWWAFVLTGVSTVFFYAQLWRRSGVMTDLEFYEVRYSGEAASLVRGFRAVYLGFFFNCIIMPP